MDTTQKVTHISLCAGYGGIDLGLRGAIPNLRTVAFSEIEGFACANLVAKMEKGLLDCAPIWTDLKTFPWGAFSDRVDILSGGYPCQPFSAAGKRLGTDDPRHLWPYIADGIRLMRPRVCFFENVSGHISLGLREVISELESMGYKVSWGIFSARECGAPHQRKRVFILAHRKSEGSQRRLCGRTHQEWKDINGYAGCSGAGSGIWPSRPGQPQHGWEPPRVVGNSMQSRPSSQWASSREQNRPSESSRSMGNAAEQGLSERGCGAIHASRSVEKLKRPDQIVDYAELGDADCGRQSSSIDTRCGGQTIVGGQSDLEPSERWQIEPSLGGDADGSPSGLDYAELCVTCDNRTDELRLLGNGVVPATATLAFRTLLQEIISA